MHCVFNVRQPTFSVNCIAQHLSRRQDRRTFEADAIWELPSHVCIICIFLSLSVGVDLLQVLFEIEDKAS